MGARNESEISSIWFMNILYSKFTRRTDQQTPNSKMRVNGADKEVWENHYNTVDGYLTKMEIKNSGYQDAEQVHLTLVDKDVTIILQIDLYSTVFRSFAKRLPNIEPKKVVELSVWEAEYLGSSYTAIAVRNGEKETVKAAFEDKDLPSIDMVKIQGKDVRDYTMLTERLKLEVDKYNEKVNGFEPTFEVVHPADPTIPVATQTQMHKYILPKEPKPPVGAKSTNPEDDLPF